MNDIYIPKDIYELINNGETGDLNAIQALSLIYFFGTDDVERDLSKYVYWLKKAADLGDIPSQYNLAMCYDQAIGVPMDRKKSIKWHQKAADQGHIFSKGFLAEYYLTGKYLPIDINKGLNLLISSAQGGDVFSMVELFNIYSTGRYHGKICKGIQINTEKKYFWLKKAAAEGDRYALEILGISLINGYDISKNIQYGVTCLKLAAEQDSIIAQSFLGLYYELGMCGEKNISKSVSWYLKATHKQRKLTISTFDIERIKITIDSEENKQQTYYIYSSNSSFAWYRLGHLYETGTYFPYNLEAAKECYRKACNTGNETAYTQLKFFE